MSSNGRSIFKFIRSEDAQKSQVLDVASRIDSLLEGIDMNAGLEALIAVFALGLWDADLTLTPDVVERIGRVVTEYHGHFDAVRAMVKGDALPAGKGREVITYN